MAVGTPPRGKISEWLIKDESSFGVAATGNYTKTLAFSDTLEEKQGWQEDNVLGAPQHNVNDATAPEPDLPTADGNIVVPLDLAHIGYWLKGLLGAPSTSGTGNLTHVFSSATSALPHRTLEKKVDTALFMQYLGVAVKTMQFDLQRGPGYDKATIGLRFKKEVSPIPTSSGGGTPATIAARDPLLKCLPVFKISAATVADVLSIQLTADNMIADDDSLGDANGYIQGHDRDMPFKLSGTMRLRFRNSTMYALAKARAALSTEFLWSKSGTRSLSLAPGELYLAPAGVMLSGPGRIEQNYSFTCNQSAAAPALLATLKNGVAGY